jgi:hypothetical protein
MSEIEMPEIYNDFNPMKHYPESNGVNDSQITDDQSVTSGKSGNSRNSVNSVFSITDGKKRLFNPYTNIDIINDDENSTTIGGYRRKRSKKHHTIRRKSKRNKKRTYRIH